MRIPLAYYIALGEFSLTLPFRSMSLEIGPFTGLGLGLYGCWIAMTVDLAVRGTFFLVRFALGRGNCRRYKSFHELP